ncbi:MAG: hypothetical protein ACLTXL_15805 [Clostridia bacterium]
MNQAACQVGVLYNLRFDPRGIAGKTGKDIIEGIIQGFMEVGIDRSYCL